MAWPDAVRQRVRDDYPFLSCLEMGVRCVRTPAADLDDELQSERLALLRREGVGILFVWLWSDRLELAESVLRHRELIDAMEVQVPGTLWPDAACLSAIARCQKLGVHVTLAPFLALERTAGKYYPRARIGYRASELAELNQRLDQCGMRVDRVLCYMDPETPPWDIVQEFVDVLPLSRIGTFDFVLSLSGFDEQTQASRVSEGVFASALLAGCRLIVDPFVDLDRTPDIHLGLLDRLSNPRPAFHSARCTNTILFSDASEFRSLPIQHVGSGRILGLSGSGKRFWLLLPDGRMSISPALLDGLASGSISCFDLVAATSEIFGADGERLAQFLSDIQGPVLLMSAP